MASSICPHPFRAEFIVATSGRLTRCLDDLERNDVADPDRGRDHCPLWHFPGTKDRKPDRSPKVLIRGGDEP